MERAAALRGVVRAAFPIAFALAVAGCKSAATNAPPGAGTASTEPTTEPVTGAESGDGGAVNTTAKVSDTEPSLSTDGGVEEIRPSTRRSAAGLPEPIPDYLSWFRLGRAPEGARGTGENSAPASGAHHPACQAFILFPVSNTHKVGDAIPGDIPEGTLIVLEEKRPGRNFIDRVRTMTRVPEGWKFSSYSRGSNTVPFSEEAEISRCATCHEAPPAGAGAQAIGVSAPAGREEAPGGAASGIQSRRILE